mgnify:CR=1 FL=1
MTYASDIQTVGVSLCPGYGASLSGVQVLVIASGAVLGILSGIVFLASLVLFFTAGMWAGLAWLVIAFLISPYGLPMAAAWLVGMIGGANHALRDFVFG